MKRLALIAVALAACTSSNAPDAQTQAVFFEEMADVQAVQSDAISQAEQAAAPYSGTLNGTYNCPTSGTINLSGTYNDSDDGSSSTFDLHDTLSACTNTTAGYVIDGEWDWSGTYAPDAYHLAISGTSTITSDGQTATITQSLTIDLTANMLSMSGTITINGVLYTDFDGWSN